MRRILLLILVTAKALTAVSQVSMTVEVPPSGVLLKTQLWNILVVNSAGTSISGTLGLTVTDVVSSQQVLTAVSAPFTLAVGNNQLQSTNLSLTYDYLSPMVTDQDPNGYMPAGNFEVCYTLAAGALQSQPLEDCINLAVEPVNPVTLNLPEDGSTSEPPTPQFSWIPPAPINLFDDLTYTITLVTVQANQTPAEALEQNVPVFIANNISDIFLNFPSSAQPLDTTDLYAWQVIALNDNEYSCQSDVWTFRVPASQPDTSAADLSPYVSLERTLDASIADCYGTLRFEYYNQNADSADAFTLSSLRANDFGTVYGIGTVPLQAGDNLQQIPLSNYGLTDGGVYLFQLVNQRNEQWSIKLTYHVVNN